jgi:NADH:ubiquinone oxidoreductase subunit E
MSSGHRHVASRGPREWNDAQLAEIATILAKYPTKQAAIMPVLWLAQDSFEWLDLDVMRLIGRTLDLPPSHVHAVATFYTMFKKVPTGRFVIDVCQTLSCQLVGADRIIYLPRQRARRAPPEHQRKAGDCCKKQHGK